jgi:hypothetical protein
MSVLARRVFLLVGLYLCVATLAQAETQSTEGEELPAQQLLFELHDDSGWKLDQRASSKGVTVYRKDIEGTDLPGFRGELEVAADSELLFALVADLDGHAGLSDAIPLGQSEVLARWDGGLDYVQVLDSPAWTLTRDRYWINRASIERDILGRKGHHRQTWKGLSPSLYPARRSAVLDEYPGAIRTPVNLGSWEVIPVGPTRSRLVYRVLSDPGGRLPSGLQTLVTASTLPENLLQFEAEALRRVRR